MQKNEQYWKEKLMAFLHDPPCKCFDIGRHEKIAASARRVAGISDEDYEAFQKEADWAASAADRFPFPPYKCSSKFTGDSEYPFRHPMGGSSLEFRNPVETAALAEEKFQKSIGGIPSTLDSWHDKFFLYWRRWPEESAKQDPRLAYLPADTRISDHTIWTHMSLTSAFQGCVQKGELKPAFLIFQFGPVQDFIAQAKSTRDLWSGSYLLSWLTAHAIKAVTDESGPDSVIFPSLRGQPIYDLLHKELYESIKFKDDDLWTRMYKVDINDGMRRLLTPTIPNRFCALVPEWRVAEIAGKAEDAIKSELRLIGDAVWGYLEKEGKVGTGVDKERWDKQLELFPQITWQAMPWENGIVAKGALKQLEDLALEVIPTQDRDGRNYKDGKLNAGFYWSAHFDTAINAMAGRRNLRDFEQFITDKHQAGTPKNPSSGKKDPISGKEEQVGQTGHGAIMNIKREFAEQYLQTRIGFTTGQFNYAMRFKSTQALSRKNKHDNNRYIAVLAMDGDEIGKWLSGEKTPRFIDQLSGKAVDYFNGLKGFDPEMKRAISPAYHLQFSEALSNFALHLVERVVRNFEGQLIYAGGDDVLAMLPASYALECAEALRACFRGKDMPVKLHNKLDLAIIHEGFVNADRGYPLLMPGAKADVSCGIAVGHDKYPLQALVHEAQNAEKRAKIGYGRSAFAVSLIKRGGETIQWGAKWNASALPLYKQFSELSDDKVFSGRFPYALAGLLKPYQLDAHDKEGEPIVSSGFKEVIEREFDHVLIQQCEGILADNEKKEFRGKAIAYLNHLFELGRPEDFANLFLTSTFMNRQRGE